MKQQISMKLDSVHVNEDALDIDQGGHEPVNGQLHPAHESTAVAGSFHPKD